MTRTERAGIAMVICAPSGTGKTTLVRRLEKEFPRFAVSLSCTTRLPREGEVDGVDYAFIGRETFTELRDAGYFAEWAEVHGSFYGTPLKATQDLLSAGRDVLFDIDVQGAAQLRRTLPDALFVFLLPPSREELEKRLRSRGTESDESLRRRMENARTELAQANWFNVWIINDDLKRAYGDLTAVYRAAALCPARCPEFVNELLEEWR